MSTVLFKWADGSDHNSYFVDTVPRIGETVNLRVNEQYRMFKVVDVVNIPRLNAVDVILDEVPESSPMTWRVPS